MPKCAGAAIFNDPASWPKPAWQPCGVGCQVASPLEADATDAFGDGASSAVSEAGDFYYQTQAYNLDHTYLVLRRLSDDRALAVLRVPLQCWVAGGQAAAPFVFEFIDGDANATWMGHYAVGTKTFVPPQSSVSLNGQKLAWFSWDTAVGSLTVSGGPIRVLFDGQTQLQTLYQPTAPVDNARARAGFVAWVDWAIPPTARGWTQQAGVNVLFSAPSNAVGFAMSDQAIAVLGVTGQLAQAGSYDTAQIYWSPFSTTAAGIQIHAGADVSGQVAGPMHNMSTAGDFVAVTRNLPAAFTSTSTGILVSQMSTGKLWSLKPRPNTALVLAGVSGTEALAQETDFAYAQQHGIEFQRWLRLDLTKLDQLVTTLPAGM
jgi:hypothetical protein